MSRVYISQKTIRKVVFHADVAGYISAMLGGIMIVDGFVTLSDAKEAVKKWLEENDGLIVEY